MELAWRLIAERRIQEAIEEGKFDNLPGKGQPLNLEEDMSTPPHLRVANRILKNAGVLPDWMQLDAEIDKERENVRKSFERLQKEFPRRKARALSLSKELIGSPEKRKLDFAKWLVKERTAYVQAMKRVNTEITKLLMLAPSVTRVHIPFKIEVETARFDEEFPALPGIEAPSPPEPEREDPLKEAARAIYAERRRHGGLR